MEIVDSFSYFIGSTISQNGIYYNINEPNVYLSDIEERLYFYQFSLYVNDYSFYFADPVVIVGENYSSIIEDSTPSERLTNYITDGASVDEILFLGDAVEVINSNEGKQAGINVIYVKDGTVTNYPLAYQIVFGVFNINVTLPNTSQSVVYTANGIDIQTNLRDGYIYQNLGDIIYVNDGTEW